ncbi:cytochrome c oxidase subunit II [Dyella acidiphila]|uniref:Cytochrome c oxidase subunit 2 n=1 Tax=Dyella acidiphila TaxID=2775866 RepID=A0ABR9GBY0_9GAMM|nr:cytochrome c oxidase subunit II [Dyella acidiphila]MBE1161540.1 cytochrome c oxidase subunit II [Dyella acidiphila]
MSVVRLPQASSFAPSIDHMFDAMVILCGVVAIGVFAVMIGMCIVYRRGSKADRSIPVAQQMGIELAWTLIPFLLFVGIFAWSIRLWVHLRSPPADSLTIYVVAKQWMWKVQHPDGRREIDALHVPLGKPVRLIMTSEDVVHSFYIPAFRIKQDVVPGRYTQLWFKATQAGNFQLYCSEYCGTNHAAMLGTVSVLPASDYARWLVSVTAMTPEQRGRQLFVQMGCSGCHDPQSGIRAPDLHGLYNMPVHLNDGTVVQADDAYLRESIVFPASKIVQGYTPIMPTYQHRVDEEGILALIAYIRSIGPAPPAASQDRSSHD